MCFCCFGSFCCFHYLILVPLSLVSSLRVPVPFLILVSWCYRCMSDISANCDIWRAGQLQLIILRSITRKWLTKKNILPLLYMCCSCTARILIFLFFTFFHLVQCEKKVIAVKILYFHNNFGKGVQMFLGQFSTLGHSKSINYIDLALQQRHLNQYLVRL